MRRLRGSLYLSTVFVLGSMIFAMNAFAQESFYKGKMVRIVVGFSPGGGFDTYTRTIAKHLRKHIPGNPSVIVSNMAGAGSLVLANHLYKVADPDGLTIGNWNGGLVMGQVLGQSGIQFDARRFEWIGAPVSISPVCLFSKASGITSIESWAAAKTPVPIGTIGSGSNTHDVPKILSDALKLPTQLVPGYKGFANIRVAIEAGEVAGGCPTWEATRGTWDALESGAVTVVVQAVPRPASDLAKVPMALALAKGEDNRQLIEAGIHSMNDLNRPYSLPPGTPKDRVQTLRKAFEETLNDPEFLADAKKSRLGVDPISGQEIDQMVQSLFKLLPAVIAKLKAALQ
jgi:tripartite-type tricarboxylate transporter receptor subunit TctC